MASAPQEEIICKEQENIDSCESSIEHTTPAASSSTLGESAPKDCERPGYFRGMSQTYSLTEIGRSQLGSPIFGIVRIETQQSEMKESVPKSGSSESDEKDKPDEETDRLKLITESLINKLHMTLLSECIKREGGIAVYNRMFFNLTDYLGALTCYDGNFIQNILKSIFLSIVQQGQDYWSFIHGLLRKVIREATLIEGFTQNDAEDVAYLAYYAAAEAADTQLRQLRSFFISMDQLFEVESVKSAHQRTSESISFHQPSIVSYKRLFPLPRSTFANSSASDGTEHYRWIITSEFHYDDRIVVEYSRLRFDGPDKSNINVQPVQPSLERKSKRIQESEV